MTRFATTIRPPGRFCGPHVGVALAAALIASGSFAAPQANTPVPPAPGPAQRLGEALEGWQLDHLNLSEAIGEARQVRILNPFGSIYLRANDEGSPLEVATVAQRHDDDPYQLVLDHRRDGQELVVEVRRVLTPGRDDPNDAAVASKRRLDMTVFSPPGVPVVARALDSIETKKFRADVDLEVQQGFIRLDTSGRPRARTEGGEIFGVLRATNWSEPGRIVSRTGKISLYFLPDADIRIEATSMGLIGTDFSLEIEREPGKRRKTARAKLGAGTASLVIHSEIGEIQLLLNV